MKKKFEDGMLEIVNSLIDLKEKEIANCIIHDLSEIIEKTNLVHATLMVEDENEIKYIRLNPYIKDGNDIDQNTICYIENGFIFFNNKEKKLYFDFDEKKYFLFDKKTMKSEIVNIVGYIDIVIVN